MHVCLLMKGMHVPAPRWCRTAVRNSACRRHQITITTHASQWPVLGIPNYYVVDAVQLHHLNCGTDAVLTLMHFHETFTAAD